MFSLSVTHRDAKVVYEQLEAWLLSVFVVIPAVSAQCVLHSTTLNIKAVNVSSGCVFPRYNTAPCRSSVYCNTSGQSEGSIESIISNRRDALVVGPASTVSLARDGSSINMNTSCSSTVEISSAAVTVWGVFYWHMDQTPVKRSPDAVQRRDLQREADSAITNWTLKGMFSCL